MKILEKIQSELLPRTETTAEIEHTTKATPSKESIKEELAKELKTNKDFIIVKHIYTNFGEGKSKIIAYAYKDKESIKKIEKTSKKKKLKETAKEEQKEEPKAQKEEVKENGKETN